MNNKIWISCALTFLAACSGDQSAGPTAETSDFLVDNAGWGINESLYILPPGSTIAVCDTGVKAGVADLVAKAVRIWADKGGRDERLKIVQGCSGDRILKLVRVPATEPYFGRVSPMQGSTHRVDVPDKWAGHWTANHEVGHLFGFAHIFQGTVSIMNSEANGAYMNNGLLSDYDLSEVKRFLQRQGFANVNKQWADKSTTTSPETTTPPETATPPSTTTPDQEKSKSCTGADGSTVYKHGTVTTYKGDTYTCDQGEWIFSKGTQQDPGQETSKSCTGVDGRTVYKHGTVTTYQGKAYTCDQGEWIRALGA